MDEDRMVKKAYRMRRKDWDEGRSSEKPWCGVTAAVVKRYNMVELEEWLAEDTGPKKHWRGKKKWQK